MMCGCALVCSDPPVVSGYRTNTTLIQVLGGNGVEPSPWWWSTADLLVSSPAANDVSLHPGYPCTVHCEEQAAAQWGIEAEATLQSGLHHTHVDWDGGAAENALLQYLGAEYAKCSCSLKNLDLGNLLVGAVHYLRACECIILSPWSIKASLFVLSTSICMGGRLILGFFFTGITASEMRTLRVAIFG